MPVPPTPSFNCECDQCGARVFGLRTAVQSNPSACVRLEAQRMTTKSNKKVTLKNRFSDGPQIMKLNLALTNVRYSFALPNVHF